MKPLFLIVFNVFGNLPGCHFFYTMEGDILLKGGRVVTGDHAETCDILIRDGVILEMAPDIPAPEGACVRSLTGLTVVQGFADIHVHFREPGFTAKETIRTGSRAAARGGYTLVCAMPNLDPVPDSPENLAVEQAAIVRDAVIQVLPYGSITKGRRGEELVDFHSLKGSCAAFSDDGSGVQQEAVMRKAMQEAAREDVILAAHCEDNTLLRGGYIHDGAYCASHGHKGICSESEWGQIRRDLRLCAETGCRYHVCHISTRESVDLIREAKASGVRVTCETAPHYLVLCEDDLREEGRFKMNPPLRSARDREALIEGLLDGTIDAIATDHAPHTAEEKSRGLKGSAMGIVGLETSFPVLYTHLVRTGRMTLERLVQAMCEAPRHIFRLGGELRPGQPADLAVLDLTHPFRIDSRQFASMGKSTPFDGWEVYGKVLMTIKDGRTVYEANQERI